MTSFEIIVVVRVTDRDTLRVVDGIAKSTNVPINMATVDRAGYVNAMRHGWEQARGRYVAFCDDDARYASDWLSHLISLFAHADVGAAGGVILQTGYKRKRAAKHKFVSVAWYGRTSYHAFDEPDFVEPINVDWLPGANMAIRRDVLTPADFLVELDSKGSSPGTELSLCWRVRAQGFRVVLDPKLVVSHMGAPWVGAERGLTAERTYAYSRNTMLVMLSNMGLVRRVVFAAYFWVIGQIESPGLLVGAIVLFRERSKGPARLASSFRGKFDGAILSFRLRRHAQG
jgi:GT2 family glycosyltransferase